MSLWFSLWAFYVCFKQPSFQWFFDIKWHCSMICRRADHEMIYWSQPLTIPFKTSALNYLCLILSLHKNVYITIKITSTPSPEMKNTESCKCVSFNYWTKDISSLRSSFSAHVSTSHLSKLQIGPCLQTSTLILARVKQGELRETFFLQQMNVKTVFSLHRHDSVQWRSSEVKIGNANFWL